MVKQNRVSVKSVTAQQGHDGIGWRCRVYLDGKMLKGWCVEDGYGGGLYFNGAEPSTNDALDQICEIAIDADPELGKFMPKSAWEVIVSDLVGAALEEKEMMRRTTKEVWFQLEGEDPSTVRTFKRRHKISGPNCADEEAAIIDAIEKVAIREGKAITNILGIRKATDRLALVEMKREAA